ncbi:MAG: hypothetical protein SXQ77_11410 [Halobacteria archaeon]|nr:hypothetical protein [Halobacteria archaeon]
MKPKLPRLPTKADDWRLMARTVRLVTTIPSYALASLITSILGLSVFVVAQNLDLFTRVVVFGNVSVGARLSVLAGLYPVVGSAYTLVQSIVLLAIALLLGVNFAVIVYHFREHGISAEKGAGGIGGLVLGTLGAGCAACGPAVLAALVSVFGVSGVLTLLPLDGLEFSLLAVIILVLSIYWISEGMRGGEIQGCPVDI